MRVPSTAQMETAHAAYRAATTTRRAEAGAGGAASVIRRNVAAVLDLGNVVYYHFRGRAYGVPPLPWQAGQRLLALWLALLEFHQLTPDTSPAYYRLLAQLPALLWRYSRPVGRVARLAYALGLYPNPLRRATEGELVNLASFFLPLRTRSSVSLAATRSGLALPTS